MKKADLKVGGRYSAKVSDTVVVVHIDAENPHGGWDATNESTGKKVRIKSAQRLRYAMAKKDGKWRRVAASGGKDATRANVGDDTATRGKAKTKKKAKGGGNKQDGSRAPVKGGSTWPAPGKPGEAKPKKPSLLDLAAEVLAKAKGPMDCKTIVEKVLATGRWQTKGATPAATLSSAIHRDCQKNGRDSRFRKVERGKFTLAK